MGVSDRIFRSPSFQKKISFILHFSGLIITFTFMHLADTFIQSDLQLHSGYTFLIMIRFVLDPAQNLYFDLTIRGTDTVCKVRSRTM